MPNQGTKIVLYLRVVWLFLLIFKNIKNIKQTLYLESECYCFSQKSMINKELFIQERQYKRLVLPCQFWRKMQWNPTRVPRLQQSQKLWKVARTKGPTTTTLWMHQPLRWDSQCIQVTEWYSNQTMSWVILSTMNFAGEIQSPSVGPVGLASVMFHATLTVATSNQLPAHQGCLSLPPWYISKISQLSTLRQMHYMERYWSGKVTLFNVHGSGASLSTPVMCNRTRTRTRTGFIQNQNQNRFYLWQ